MDVVVSRCAGIDIGKAEGVVCLRIPGAHGERLSEVRTFRAFAGEVGLLADSLAEQRVSHLVMEATGQYWKPVWDVRYRVKSRSSRITRGGTKWPRNRPCSSSSASHAASATVLRPGTIFTCRVLTNIGSKPRSANTTVCPSCSDLFARDTWQLIHAGLHGGHHDVPATVAEHPQIFVTLTAPSFGAVHTIRATGSCQPRDTGRGNCQHRRPVWCERGHENDDPALGQPLCAECYDYIRHVLFSWHAPELWRRFTIQLRRLLSRELRHRAEKPKEQQSLVHESC